MAERTIHSTNITRIGAEMNTDIQAIEKFFAALSKMRAEALSVAEYRARDMAALEKRPADASFGIGLYTDDAGRIWTREADRFVQQQRQGFRPSSRYEPMSQGLVLSGRFDEVTALLPGFRHIGFEDDAGWVMERLANNSGLGAWYYLVGDGVSPGLDLLYRTRSHIADCDRLIRCADRLLGSREEIKSWMRTFVTLHDRRSTNWRDQNPWEDLLVKIAPEFTGEEVVPAPDGVITPLHRALDAVAGCEGIRTYG